MNLCTKYSAWFWCMNHFVDNYLICSNNLKPTSYAHASIQERCYRVVPRALRPAELASPASVLTAFDESIESGCSHKVQRMPSISLSAFIEIKMYKADACMYELHVRRDSGLGVVVPAVTASKPNQTPASPAWCLWIINVLSACSNECHDSCGR